MEAHQFTKYPMSQDSSNPLAAFASSLTNKPANISIQLELSKSKFYILINIVNVVSIIIFISATIINLTLTEVFSVVLINLYGMVLGLTLLQIEFKHHRVAIEHAKLIVTWRGRGLLYFFLGSLIIQPKDYNLFAGIFLLSAGLGFFLASFTRNIAPLNDWITNARRYKELRDTLRYSNGDASLKHLASANCGSQSMFNNCPSRGHEVQNPAGLVGVALTRNAKSLNAGEKRQASETELKRSVSRV